MENSLIKLATHIYHPQCHIQHKLGLICGYDQKVVGSHPRVGSVIITLLDFNTVGCSIKALNHEKWLSLCLDPKLCSHLYNWTCPIEEQDRIYENQKMSISVLMFGEMGNKQVTSCYSCFVCFLLLSFLILSSLLP